MDNSTNTSSKKKGPTQLQVDALLGTVIAFTILGLIFVIWFRCIRNRKNTNEDRVIKMNDVSRIPNPIYKVDNNIDNNIINPPNNLELNIIQPRYETISPDIVSRNNIRSIIINDNPHYPRQETGL
tara:strand:+ start:115 stop:492 length:378 start_codon:yes stop_codon:yes gene_type:complete